MAQAQRVIQFLAVCLESALLAPVVWRGVRKEHERGHGATTGPVRETAVPGERADEYVGLRFFRRAVAVELVVPREVRERIDVLLPVIDLRLRRVERREEVCARPAQVQRKKVAGRRPEL